MLYVNPLETGMQASESLAAVNDQRRGEALKEYERLFLYQLMQEMRKTVPEGGIFGDSKQEEFFEEMLDDVYAGEMADSGQFGIARIMEQQLEAAQASLKKETQFPQGIALHSSQKAYALAQEALKLPGQG